MATASGLLVATGASRNAEACSYGQSPDLVGYPSDGATGVPTDVLPFYDKVAAAIDDLETASQLFALRSATGASISLALTEPYWTTLELAPAAELEPNTTYTLEATLNLGSGRTPSQRTLVFTTGAGRAEAPALPVGLFLEHYAIREQPDDCARFGQQGTCLAMPAGRTHVGTFIDEFGQRASGRYLWQKPPMINLSGINQGTNFSCVEVAARGANGALGQATVLCGEDAPLSEYESAENVTCTSKGLSFEGAAGCTISAAPRGSAPGAWWVVGFVAGAFFYRRSRA